MLTVLKTKHEVGAFKYLSHLNMIFQMPGEIRIKNIDG